MAEEPRKKITIKLRPAGARPAHGTRLLPGTGEGRPWTGMGTGKR